MRRSPSWIPAIVAGALVSSALALLVPAAHASTCLYDSPSRTLMATATSGDTSMTIRANDGYVSVDGDSCVELDTVDSINVDVSASSLVQLTLDLRVDPQGGPLVPGFTDEGDGSSEIELTITGLNKDKELRILGTPDTDSITLGEHVDEITDLRTGQINLNAAGDGATPDVDVSFTTFPGWIRVVTDEDDDVVSAGGIGIDGSDPYGKRVSLDGGPGTNELTGGDADDVVYLLIEDAASGSETVSGGAGHDTLELVGPETDVATSITLDGVANDGARCPGINCDGDGVAGDFETLIGTSNRETIVGNAGLERIEGRGGNDTLRGGPGGDVIVCDGGRAYGEDGLDTLHVRPGCALISGGTDNDDLFFLGYDAGVVLRLDNFPNDGAASQGLNVKRDIELIVGTKFGDMMTGNSLRNEFLGAKGPDSLRGRDGNDRILGNEGNDFLSGDDGRDLLNGGDGRDVCADSAASTDFSGCEVRQAS